VSRTFDIWVIKACTKKPGCKKWKEKQGYVEDGHLNVFFPGVKRVSGETVRAKAVEGTVREVRIKFLLHNLF